MSKNNEENKSKNSLPLLLGLILGLIAGLFMSGIVDKNSPTNEELKMQGRIEILSGKVGCFIIDNDGEKINWKCYSRKELQVILNSAVIGGNNVR